MHNRLLISDDSLYQSGVSLGLVIAALVLLNGCGAETYEQRLKETSQYFSYQDTRNQALSSFWSAPSVELKVPIEFQQISAPPKKPASKDGEAESPEPENIVDPRQPDYADLFLPGLEGAWRCEVPVDVNDETEERPAYLYVLSNASLLKEKQMDAALNFFEDVNNQIARSFNQFIKNEEFKTERFPQGKGYTDPKPYNVGTFEPETPIEEIPYQFVIYQTENGNNQVVILLVIPKNMTNRSKIKEHMDYSLETVNVTSPQSGNSRSGSGSTKF